MSIRVSGVYLMASSEATENNNPNELNNEPNNQLSSRYLHHNHHHHHHHHQGKTVTIVAAAPQRSNSLDYLNFEEKRQIIASSLSLSDFLAHGPAAAAAAAAKEVAANTVVIGEFFFIQFFLGTKGWPIIYHIKGSQNILSLRSIADGTFAFDIN